jgi:hypothetical protein
MLRPVATREVTGKVCLYVPRPSGDLLRTELGDEYEADLAAAGATKSGTAPAPSSDVNTINNFSGAAAGTVIQAGQIRGGVFSGGAAGGAEGQAVSGSSQVRFTGGV